jgi:hypothetical protein
VRCCGIATATLIRPSGTFSRQREKGKSKFTSRQREKGKSKFTSRQREKGLNFGELDG